MNTREKIVSIINKFDGLKSTSTRSMLVFIALLVIVLLVSAISILIENRVGDATLSSISRATIEAYRYGQPVKTRRQALIAVQQDIMYSHLNLLDTPTLDFAGKMRYAQAEKRVSPPGYESYTDWQRAEQTVWLVIFRAHYTVTGPMGVETPRAYGCIYGIIDAESGEGMQAGSGPCKNIGLPE